MLTELLATKIKNRKSNFHRNKLKRNMARLSENMPKRTRLYIAGLAGLGLIILVTYYKYGSRNSSISGPQDCFFCDFAHHRPSSRGPNPNLEVETEDYVIFKDKYPAAQHHYLAIPKEHLESFSVLNRSHLELVQRMELGMIELFRSKNLDPDEAILGFHIPPFISVKHLHLHGIYPPSDMSFLNKINFLPSFWFKKSKDAIRDLENREL